MAVVPALPLTPRVSNGELGRWPSPAGGTFLIQGLVCLQPFLSQARRPPSGAGCVAAHTTREEPARESQESGERFAAVPWFPPEQPPLLSAIRRVPQTRCLVRACFEPKPCRLELSRRLSDGRPGCPPGPSAEDAAANDPVPQVEVTHGARSLPRARAAPCQALSAGEK